VGKREEFKLCAGEDDAGQTVYTDQVADVRRALLGDHENRAVIGEIALHVPGRAESGRRLGGSTEIDVRASQPEVGGAVELDAGGDTDIGGEYDLRPRSGAVSGGRVGEGVGSEIRKLSVIQERHNAGLGRGARNVWVRGHGIAGADNVGSGAERERGEQNCQKKDKWESAQWKRPARQNSRHGGPPGNDGSRDPHEVLAK